MQVVSQVANATGEVVLLPDLNGVQGVAFERPTVVLAQVCKGHRIVEPRIASVLRRSVLRSDCLGVAVPSGKPRGSRVQGLGHLVTVH